MTNKAALLSALVGASMVATPAIAVATTYDVDAPQAQNTVAEVTHETAVSSHVTADATQATFTYDQATITPNSVIKDIFMRNAKALCGAADGLDIVNAESWELSVSGDVGNAFVATLGDLKETTEQTVIMGCTCASNTADGRASVTAKVTGVDLKSIIQLAKPSAECNTITLYSEDGYKMVLPMSYIFGTDAVISYNINDEPLSESVGGTNQLWINGAAAKFFTRNITSIEITAEAEEPAAPGYEAPNDGEYQNRPNVGIMASRIY